jgi:hypothetical protein
LAGNTNIGYNVSYLSGCQHSIDVLIRVKFGDCTNDSNFRSNSSGMH